MRNVDPADFVEYNNIFFSIRRNRFETVTLGDKPKRFSTRGLYAHLGIKTVEQRGKFWEMLHKMGRVTEK